MTAIHSHPGAQCLRSIDRGFHPDLRKHLDATGLESLAHLGIEPIGEPFPGQPGTRSALWYSRVPSEAGELAVIAVVNPIVSPLMSNPGGTKWYAGCVPPSAQSVRASEGTLARYAEYAGNITPTPAAAIVLAHILLRGTEEAAKEILYYRTVE